ncbi:hypothetical protein [Nocardia tengchongensis]|uniref:hypothetical protein n=1 Tax=Nocardia tengchongensis TaxID=2055889 RepID=UPI0036BA6640
MSRHSTPATPVENRATNIVDFVQFNPRFAAVLNKQTHMTREVVVRVFNGETLEEIAETSRYLDRQGVKAALLTTLETLRLAGRRDNPLEAPSHDLDRLVHLLREGIRRRQEREALILCRYHGWTEPTGRGTCSGCTCHLNPPHAGRPPKYCSNACKQRGYRGRVTQQSPV